MKKKAFITINLSEKIKNDLVKYQEKIDSQFAICPIKWTRKDSLHIIMFFVGFVGDDELLDVFNKS